MEDVIKVASYVCLRYEKEYGERIDEMKLHKLLYLIQRESIIQTGEPMFPDRFQAWRFGPVMVEVRNLYKVDGLKTSLDEAAVEKYKDIFDKVFETFSGKDSWTLSCLTHCEYSYKKARGEKLKKYDDCSEYIDTEDIRVDAEHVRMRRYLHDKMVEARLI